VDVEITVANADAVGRNYLTWTPVKATARLVVENQNNPAVPEPVTVSNGSGSGGRLEFALDRGKPRTAALDLVLPADGSPADFWVAGAVGSPSIADSDTSIEVVAAAGGQPVGTKAVMVRIRKDAEKLTAAERDRFTTAMAILNNQGTGLFRDFREMHRLQIALNQAHGAPGFLAWHRAYLLDLERELQKIDPSVALPYWRFDKPAPNVFTPGFMGGNGATGNTVIFSATNLLREWRTDSIPGVTRRPRFNPATESALVSSDAATLLLGGMRPNAMFDTGPAGGGFDEMEDNPHGHAHTSFNGVSFIRDTAKAPRDPLFFLLHCNVDRLWARWQWFNNRFDGTQAHTYFYQGTVTSNPHTAVGHNLLDTMWPWNNVTGGNRPLNAPRTPFPLVPTATAPGGAPTVKDMIDYQAHLQQSSYMNFAYDDVPFGVAP